MYRYISTSISIYIYIYNIYISIIYIWWFLICYLTQIPTQTDQPHKKKHVKLQTVTNLPQKRATKMFNPVPSSKFSEFSHCDDNFAIAPQKT